MDDQVNDLNPDKRGDDASHPKDQHVAGQNFSGGHGAVFYTLHGQRNEAGNDDGIENQRRKNGTVRRCQIHDIQHTQFRNGRHEHSRDNGKVLGNIVGDGERGQGPAG